MAIQASQRESRIVSRAIFLFMPSANENPVKHIRDFTERDNAGCPPRFEDVVHPLLNAV
jgi:hypothetical protein